MPLPAIIMICVGCALIVAGLVFVIVKMLAVIKAARQVGINNMADLEEIVGRVQRLEPRFREFEQRQAAVAESLRRLQEQAEDLAYLKEQLDRATGYILKIKS